MRSQGEQVMNFSHPLKVSVALCTHNGAHFLREQVRSICLQTLPPAEIVLSDDASTDGSVDVVRATVAECVSANLKHPVVLRIFENRPALRVVKNFEQAISACSSELIALSDQDDVWMSDRLEKMVDRFEQDDRLVLLHTDARLVDADRCDIGHTLFHALEVSPFELERVHAGNAFDVLLRRNLVTGATTVFRRSLLADALPLPMEWVHDEWLGIIASTTARIDLLEEPLIEYRQHASNQIGARRNTFAEKVRKALAPRGNTHVERAIKAELLLARLLLLGDRVSPEILAKVRSKIEHQRFRAALPASRLARCIPVLREAMTGRYDKFGRGFRGIVRDLFESV
jgi:glycosyltransferase involved in cell wall biosynthesis